MTHEQPTKARILTAVPLCPATAPALRCSCYHGCGATAVRPAFATAPPVSATVFPRSRVAACAAAQWSHCSAGVASPRGPAAARACSPGSGRPRLRPRCRQDTDVGLGGSVIRAQV